MSGMDRLTEREWLISLLTIDQEQMLTDYEVHPAAWKGDPDRIDCIAALADGILDGLAHRRSSQAAPAPPDGLRAAAATILAVLQDPDSLPIEKHPDWQAIYNAMTADHNESVEISGDSWHDWPSILIAGLEVMAQDSAALAKIAQDA